MTWTKSTGTRRHRLGVAVAVVSAALATAAAGCGGGSDGSASSGSKSSGGAADLSKVKAEIDKYTAVPKFDPPGPAFNAKAAAGKTIFNLPITSAVPFNVVTDNAMAEAAHKVGVKFVEYSNQGHSDQWVQGVSQAIQQHANLLNLFVTDPRVLQPQLAKADAAGIPSISTQFYDETQVNQAAAHLAAVTPGTFTHAARLMADWAIKDTGGKANVIIVKSGELIFMNPAAAAIEDEFHKYCPACKATVINVPNNEWAQKIQPEVQSALVRDPTINYVLPIVDPMSQFVVPAITASGRTGKVHIATFNGTPFVLKMIEQADIVRMDVGQSLQWLGYAATDQMLRKLAGQPPVKSENLPLRIFTKDNIAETGTPPAYNKGFGNSYLQGYSKLWGVGL